MPHGRMARLRAPCGRGAASPPGRPTGGGRATLSPCSGGRAVAEPPCRHVPADNPRHASPRSAAGGQPRDRPKTHQQSPADSLEPADPLESFDWDWRPRRARRGLACCIGGRSGGAGQCRHGLIAPLEHRHVFEHPGDFQQLGHRLIGLQQYESTPAPADRTRRR